MDGWIEGQTKLDQNVVVKRPISDVAAINTPILKKVPTKMFQPDSTTLMSLLKLMYFCGYLPIKWKKRNSVDSSKEQRQEQHFKASILKGS